MVRLMGSITCVLPRSLRAACVTASVVRNFVAQFPGFSGVNVNAERFGKSQPGPAKKSFFRSLITGNRAGFGSENLDFGRIEARLRDKCGPDWPAPESPYIEVLDMAKAVTIKVKLVSSADTGFYYVAKKNSRTMTDKLVKKKYDPVARKHVEFRESKIK
jgi:large subunit ribosomal protein L33